MSQIIYYFIIKPLSLLPLAVLYYLSDFIFLLIYHLIGYRKKVVFANLQNSFPQKDSTEIAAIAKKFYHHLCDLIIESVKLFSISEEEGLKRFKVINPEIPDKYFDQGKSLIGVGGHYNNWEMLAALLNPPLKHQVVGIYTKLTSPFFEKKMSRSRTKFGLELLPKRKVKSFFAKNKDRPTIIVFGIDQSPSSSSKKVYWTDFLNQDTAVMFGAEKFAREYDYPVLFTSINKVRRGYYELVFEILEENPTETEYGSIIERGTKRLEKQILEKPEFWLWTHKRWKRKKEDFDVANIKKNHHPVE